MAVRSMPLPPLTGPLLWTARGLWLLVAALTLGLFLLAIPSRFAELQTICAGVNCSNPQLTIEDIRVLQGLGLSRATHAVYSLALEVIFAGVHFLIATLLFVRRSTDRIALLVSLMLMTFGPATFTGTMHALAQTSTGWQLPVAFASSLPGQASGWLVAPASTWQLPVGLVIAIGQVTFVLFFFLFPDGNLSPRWGVPVASVWIAWQVPAAFLPDSFLNAANWSPGVSVVVWTVFLGSFIFAQIYRYRRDDNAVQQQQTKWVTFGLTAALGGYFAAILISFVLSTLDLSNLIWRQAILTFIYLCMLLMPLSFAFAILKSRLWDIDILINRTLVYSALTAILALVYLGIVLLLQFVLRTFTGQGQSTLVVAASTLAIAALFNPLRKRTQNVIDRRFYRSKYDATRVLASFGAVMQSEVDLDRLTGQLLVVVTETMEPANVSLWLLDKSVHKPRSREKR